MGIEPTTFQTLVMIRYSNHWATENPSDEQVINLLADITLTETSIF